MDFDDWKDYDYSSPYMNIKDEFLDVEEFIENHRHINYCEAIINKNGKVCYVKPSHTYTLERMSGIDRNILYKEKISIYDSPLHWLLNYNKAIAIWSNGFISNKEPTKESVDALKKLIEAELVRENNLDLFY
ncbi:hypothetical protein UT300003_32640 [Clostridium sardiniense]